MGGPDSRCIRCGEWWTAYAKWSVPSDDETEWVPCPSLGCDIPAEITDPPTNSVLHHARCAAGHVIALSPNVLEHLRAQS